MSFSNCVVLRAEQVLRASLLMLGQDTDQVPVLICEACTYWSGLLLVGKIELDYLAFECATLPSEEAAMYIERGVIDKDSTPEVWQSFTRGLVEKVFLLALDRYGNCLSMSMQEYDDEMVECYDEEDDDDD